MSKGSDPRKSIPGFARNLVIPWVQHRAVVQRGRAHSPSEVVVKLYVDTASKQVQVTKDPEPKNDQNGNQRSEKNTGRLMWSTQVFVLDETGGEIITITTAGEKPSVTVGQLVAVEQLEAIPWATNGRNGVAFRAVSLKPKAGTSAAK